MSWPLKCIALGFVAVGDDVEYSDGSGWFTVAAIARHADRVELYAPVDVACHAAVHGPPSPPVVARAGIAAELVPVRRPEGDTP